MLRAELLNSHRIIYNYNNNMPTLYILQITLLYSWIGLICNPCVHSRSKYLFKHITSQLFDDLFLT